MCSNARLYNCLRCHRQVVICRRCDRGNIYCPHGCSAKARAESVHLAGKKYRSSWQGRLNNADRQRRYRLRQKQKVTHQGSPTRVAHAVLESIESRPKKFDFLKQPVQMSTSIYCSFCSRLCDPFLRHDFLLKSRFLHLFRNRRHPDGDG